MVWYVKIGKREKAVLFLIQKQKSYTCVSLQRVLYVNIRRLANQTLESLKAGIKGVEPVQARNDRCDSALGIMYFTCSRCYLTDAIVLVKYNNCKVTLMWFLGRYIQLVTWQGYCGNMWEYLQC